MKKTIYSERIFNKGKYRILYGKMNLEDLARDVDFSYITCPRREYKAQTKKALAIKVFLTFLEIVIKDIVYNATVFKLPTYKRAYMFVGEDWSDRESDAKPTNIFSFEPNKVLQISIKAYHKIVNKLCVISRPHYQHIQDNLDKYKLDPTLSLE